MLKNHNYNTLLDAISIFGYEDLMKRLGLPVEAAQELRVLHIEALKTVVESYESNQI